MTRHTAVPSGSPGSKSLPSLALREGTDSLYSKPSTQQPSATFPRGSPQAICPEVPIFHVTSPRPYEGAKLQGRRCQVCLGWGSGVQRERGSVIGAIQPLHTYLPIPVPLSHPPAPSNCHCCMHHYVLGSYGPCQEGLRSDGANRERQPQGQ